MTTSRAKTRKNLGKKTGVDNGWSLKPGDMKDMFSLEKLAALPAPFLGVAMPAPRLAEGSHAGPLPLPPVQWVAQGTEPEFDREFAPPIKVPMAMPVPAAAPIVAKAAIATAAIATAPATSAPKSRRALGSQSEVTAKPDLFEFSAIDVTSSVPWYASVARGTVSPRPFVTKPVIDPFTEAERAFFTEGEELASQSTKIDELVDVGERELPFWQRFWRR